MERLTSRDLRRVNGFLEQAYAARDLDGFIAHTLSAVASLVPSDITVYAELDFPRCHYRMVDLPREATTRHLGTFRTHIHEHPFLKHRRAGSDGSAAKISDFLSDRQFHDLGLYQEGFRKFGMDYEMAVWFPTPPGLDINLALHRTRHDFTERDRLILNALRPHLVQAYRNAEAFGLFIQAAGLEGDVPVLLNHDGRPENLSARAREILERYFGRVPGSDTLLPEKLKRWVRNQMTLLREDSDLSRAREPFVTACNDRRFVARLLSGPAQQLLLLKEERTTVEPGALEPLGLTRRQAQVLAWVAEGKTNEEIGRILGVRPRTVAKHLEMMYPKLGVENRTAAAAQALAASRAAVRS